tara:strand:- start:127 stop:267 length:141 start_codon:yes stop_codon:yes gene_type:complete
MKIVRKNPEKPPNSFPDDIFKNSIVIDSAKLASNGTRSNRAFALFY